jgi:hypothetical protein
MATSPPRFARASNQEQDLPEIPRPNLRCKIRLPDYRRREMGLKRSQAILAILKAKR